MELTESTRTFVLHWGEMGTRWGVNRTVAQVHALLYLSPDPMTAETIADTLAVARSNVSNSLHELQNWELVQVTHRIGDRRDYFKTSHDVWELFTTVVEQRIAREIEPTLTMLHRCAAEARKEKATPPETRERIVAIETFLSELHGWFTQMKTVPPASLRTLLRLGTGVTRWLPGAKKRSAA